MYATKPRVATAAREIADVFVNISGVAALASSTIAKDIVERKVVYFGRQNTPIEVFRYFTSGAKRQSFPNAKMGSLR
jgi:hypothetical protein